MVSCLSGNVLWVHFLCVFSAGMPECMGCTGAPFLFYCNYLMVWMMRILLVVLTEHVVGWVMYADFFLTLFVLSGGSFIKLTYFSRNDYYQFPNTILLPLFWFLLNEPDFVTVLRLWGSKRTLKNPCGQLEHPCCNLSCSWVRDLWTCLEV